MKSLFYRSFLIACFALLFVGALALQCAESMTRVMGPKPKTTQPVLVAPGGPVPYPTGGGGKVTVA